MKRITTTLFTLAILSTVAFAAPIEPGEKAPKVSGVDSATGKEVSSDDLQGAKATVYLFTCTHCPVAMAYEDRFIEFAKSYGEKGVKFVAINCNGEKLDEMNKRAEEKGYPFRYIADESQKSAIAFGASRTPELFVVDGKGVVQYTGAFDSDMRKPDTHYVADAVDAILAGKSPKTKSTKAFGCGIPIKRR